MTTLNHPRKIGPYRIEERLGAGGMGQVFRAYDERLERQVALKQIRPDAAEDSRTQERFLREARVAARLNHPTLVQIYDILEAQGGHWIVMELVGGETLAARLRAGPLSVPRALELAREIATGLDAAHSAGIMHRDLKAENIVLTPDDRVKILDFGLAKPLWHMGSDASLTLDGQLLGTPRSMSPEQVQGREIDHRSDLFSLGTLLYETLTGSSPFVGETPDETLQRVSRERQVPVRELAPEIPQGLSDLVDLLLSKDPGRRPQTAAKVMALLQRIDESPHAEISLANLDSQSAAVPHASPDPGLAQDRKSLEERQITVLCCDLVGISSNALDPETLYDVMPDFQALAEDVIGRFAGHVGTVLGHRLVVYFGYPRPQEDHPQRGAQAALRLVAQVESLNTQLGLQGEDRLAARVGLHTGQGVVLASGSPQEQLALGDTLDLATSLQGRAEANTVVASLATQQRIEGRFIVETLDPAPLPGSSQPVAAYRILAAQESDLAKAPPPSSDAGLKQELELVLRRWRLAREGTGQMVLLSGEDRGLKSQLLSALRREVAPDEPQWLLLHGSQLYRGSPLHPALDLLRRLAKLDSNAATDLQLTQLENWLTEHELPPADVVPLLAPLLSLPLQGRYPTSDLSPERRRAEALEAIAALLLEGAEERPLILVMEDLQWMDPSTLDLLGLLIEQGEAVPLLLLLTFDKEYEPPWRRRSNLTQLSLTKEARWTE